VSEIRQELTGHRLQLEEHQLSAMPRDLGELAYQCDAPEVTRKRRADCAQQKGQGTLLEAPLV